MSAPSAHVDLQEISTAHRDLGSFNHQLYDRVLELNDAIEMAMQRAEDGPAEAPVLNNLRARMASMFSPMQDLQTALNNAQLVLEPMERLASKIDADQRRADDTARQLQDQMGLLQEEERQLEALRVEVERRHAAADRTGGGAGASEDAARLRASLDDAQAKHRVSVHASEQQRSELEKALQDAGEMRQEMDSLRAENERMKDDARRFVRQTERRSNQSKQQIQELMQELEAAQSASTASQELLQEEKRKHRVLQMALRKELSAQAEEDGGEPTMRRTQSAFMSTMYAQRPAAGCRRRSSPT